jgi:hypothetical protein
LFSPCLYFLRVEKSYLDAKITDDD